MPPVEPLEPKTKLNYLGGINRLPLQGEGQAKLIQNARPLATGGLESRYGQELTASIGGDPTVGSITDVFAYRTTALGTRLYSLRRTSAGDKIFDNTTEITGPALSGAEYTSIVEGKGTIFISNGNSADIQYHTPDEITRAVITNSFSGQALPQCQYLEVYRNRLYAWTNTGLRFTNAGIYSTLPEVHFPDANFIQVREENVEARGLGVGDNILVLFTPDGYTVMNGTPGNNGARNDYSLQEYKGVGCGFPRTITTQGKRIAWLDTERRMRILEGPILRDLDEQNLVAEYLQATNVPAATSAQFLGHELWVSLPKDNSATERHILVYDLFLKKWIALFTGIEGYAISYLPEVNSVYIGSHDGGYIWRQANGKFKPPDDAGTLIPFELIDGQLVFGTLVHKKFYHKILCSYGSTFGTALNFSYAKDGLDSFTSFEVNPSATQPAHKWGADKWGAYAWGSAGEKVITLRPKENYSLSAFSLRLKVSGNVKGGFIYYSSKAYASLLDRDGESGIT